MGPSVHTPDVERLYAATTTPQLVEVPELTYLCVDGHGDPNTSAAYADGVQALYSVSYAARAAVRRAGGEPFKVSSLEGLWWSEDPSAFLTGDRAAWHWTMMIRQPDVATAELCLGLREEVATRKTLATARQLRTATLTEGLAAQLLHTGPYGEEGPAIQRLHEFLRDQGLLLAGHHHEIYLSDPRRSAPAKLRTILRQPCSER